jgi:hypothetical protein
MLGNELRDMLMRENWRALEGYAGIASQKYDWAMRMLTSRSPEVYVKVSAAVARHGMRDAYEVLTGGRLGGGSLNKAESNIFENWLIFTVGKLAGHARPLTPGEIGMAVKVFRNSIDYDKVMIHRQGYWLLFGLQTRTTSVTPNGEIYMKANYRGDFSVGNINDQHHFIHEMGHVWQRALGYWVRTVGMLRTLLNYDYKLDASKNYPITTWSSNQKSSLTILYEISRQSQSVSARKSIFSSGYPPIRKGAEGLSRQSI